MGNYFGKKNKENPNLRDNENEDHNLPQNLQKRKFEKPTIYRPQIFIDYYKSQLLKVNLHKDIYSASSGWNYDPLPKQNV